MYLVEYLASFIVKASYDCLSNIGSQTLKIRILDTIGCAIGGLDGEPVRRVRDQVDDFGGAERCTLIAGGRTAPDRAAFSNGALVRYLDFNDSYLAQGETCHPSDNFGAVLAAAEYAGRSGSELLAALAIAYQVQCRLSDIAPVRAKGFDHTTQGAYAAAAGVAKALGLDAVRIAHAIAISGTAFNGLRVTRTGALSNWKGLAYPSTAAGATHAAFLASRGVTGPLEVFEGTGGFMDSIAGPFEMDWSREDMERVTRTIVKNYNAEIHSQAVLEGILELKHENRLPPTDVERVDVEIFDVAYNIIGGGKEGEKTTVRTKEEADHSLPYLVAVALLDDQVMPEQYQPDRIGRADVQVLLRKVFVRPHERYSKRFPEEMPCRITVRLRGGERFVKEKMDYERFHSRPARWEGVVRKFERLAEGHADVSLRRQIEEAVFRLETIQVCDLTGLLLKVRV